MCVLLYGIYAVYLLEVYIDILRLAVNLDGTEGTVIFSLKLVRKLHRISSSISSNF